MSPIQKQLQIFFVRSKMSSKAQELVVCKNFKLVKKLGTGAFGQIYLAENKTNPAEKYAAKLEEATTKFPQLYFEAKMYKYLSSFGAVVGIPKVYAMTTEGQYNVMLMDLLGASLQDLFVQFNKKLSLKSVLMLGEQMVDRIELLHEKNVLHRDIKPDNFLMGVGKNSHILYVVDFGLSKKYIQENKHIPYKEGKQLTGTARYASINTHLGIEQSRRDDVESIGYVMMYMLRGILPWQNMKAKDTKAKYKMILEKKIATPAEVLTKGFPHQLSIFINYAKALKFQEKPDYKYLKGLLSTARKNNKIQFDDVYDWTHKMSINHMSMEMLSKKEDHFEKEKPKIQTKENYKINDHQGKTNQKDQAMNEALNNFQVTGGSLLKNQQKNSLGKDPKNQTKTNNLTMATKNNVFSSMGLQSLAVKINGPKISVVKR